PEILEGRRAFCHLQRPRGRSTKLCPPARRPGRYHAVRGIFELESEGTRSRALACTLRANQPARRILPRGPRKGNRFRLEAVGGPHLACRPRPAAPGHVEVRRQTEKR